MSVHQQACSSMKGPYTCDMCLRCTIGHSILVYPQACVVKVYGMNRSVTLLVPHIASQLPHVQTSTETMHSKNGSMHSTMIGNNTFLYPSMDDVCAAKDMREAVSMDLNSGLCLLAT